MPYIDKPSRAQYNGIVGALRSLDIRSSGELNYLLTELCLAYLNNQFRGTPANYQVRSEIVSALECAKLEFYRRNLAPYEDDKAAKNGDVYATAETLTAAERR